MGTSKSYKAKVSGQPQWGDLSSSVTRNCNGGNISANNKSKILGNFVRVAGGSSTAGRGGSKVFGRSGIKTSKKLGSFLGGFASSGGDIRNILVQTGLSNLTGKTVEDVINHLIEYCSGPASTIDDKAAKEASRKLLEQIASDAATIEEFEEKLKGRLNHDSIEDIMIQYFGYYIIEHLSVMFYEKLVREKGKSECGNLFSQIEEFIFDSLAHMNKSNPLNEIEWGSDESDRIIKNIQQDVLIVFENYEN